MSESEGRPWLGCLLTLAALIALAALTAVCLTYGVVTYNPWR